MSDSDNASDSDTDHDSYETPDDEKKDDAWVLEKALPVDRANVALLLQLEKDDVKNDLQSLEDSAVFLPPAVYDVVSSTLQAHFTIGSNDAKQKHHPLLRVFVDVLNTLAASSFIRYLSMRCHQSIKSSKGEKGFFDYKKAMKKEDLPYCKLAEQILIATAEQITRPIDAEANHRLVNACKIFQHDLLPKNGVDFWDFKERLNDKEELSAQYIYELVMHFLMRGIPLFFANVAHDAPERPLTNWFAFSTDRPTELRCVQWNDREKKNEKWQFVSLDVPIIPMPKYRPFFFDNAEDSLEKYIKFLFHDIYTIANDWDSGIDGVKSDKYFLLNPICPPRFLLIECEGEEQAFPMTKALRGPFAARTCANGVAPSYCVVAFLYEKIKGEFRVGRWKKDRFVETYQQESVIDADSRLALRYLFLERVQ